MEKRTAQGPGEVFRCIRRGCAYDPHGMNPCKSLVLVILLEAFTFPRNAGASSPKPNAQETKQATVAAPNEGSASNLVENSVVKIFSTVSYPNPYKPWERQSPVELTGSGVVIEGKHILSSAHLLLYAKDVQVQASQSGDKVSATVVALTPGMDLAILKLDDETFFDSHPPLPLSKKLPAVRDAVMAYGYPQGGRSLSVTKGIVSRIEFSGYSYGAFGLRIQIDAAVNPGNSGGPAVVGDKMVGLVFGSLTSGENIGYIVPGEEIELFLQGTAEGHYRGKPNLWDEDQTLENPALRAFLKLDSSIHGVVVHRPESDDPGYPLKKWDVITKIGDTPVDDQGMIRLDANTPVRFSYLVPKLTKQDKVPLTIWRAGKELQVEAPTSREYPRLIPPLAGTLPSYFVWGPVVFSDATQDLVRGTQGATLLSRMAMADSLLAKRVAEKPAFEGERLVVVASPFFPHRLVKGYDSPVLQVVTAVNGVRIKNLGHLVQVLRDCRDEFVTIEYDMDRRETQVFPRSDMTAATEQILVDNGVRNQGSPDAMAIWNAKPKQ